MAKSTTEILDDPELSDWQRGMLYQNLQRSQLSNERNLLNWIRTSVAFITLGFVVERFHLLLHAAGVPSAAASSGLLRTWVPLVLFLLGGLVIVLGTWEYFRVRRELVLGDWVGTTLLRDALIVAALVFLVVVLVIFMIGNSSLG